MLLAGKLNAEGASQHGRCCSRGPPEAVAAQTGRMSKDPLIDDDTMDDLERELVPAVQLWHRSAVPWLNELNTIPRQERQ